MPTFEEALKATLFGLNDAFKKADADLHQEVAAAAQAIGRLSGGIAVLELVPHSESAAGVWYTLVLRATNPSATVPLATFLVKAQGYPVVVTYPHGTAQQQALGSREEIGA